MNSKYQHLPSWYNLSSTSENSLKSCPFRSILTILFHHYQLLPELLQQLFNQLFWTSRHRGKIQISKRSYIKHFMIWHARVLPLLYIHPPNMPNTRNACPPCTHTPQPYSSICRPPKTTAALKASAHVAPLNGLFSSPPSRFANSHSIIFLIQRLPY